MTQTDHDTFIQNLDPHRKKLYWRAIRRGMKEMDIILGGYARENLATMSNTEMQHFETILHSFDVDLINYLTNKKPVPDDLNTKTFQHIKKYKPYINFNNS